VQVDAQYLYLVIASLASVIVVLFKINRKRDRMTEELIISRLKSCEADRDDLWNMNLTVLSTLQDFLTGKADVKELRRATKFAQEKVDKKKERPPSSDPPSELAYEARR
jgi:hypothetical protein